MTQVPGLLKKAVSLRRSGFAQAGQGFVETRAHKLGALRAVRPHVLHVRCGRQIPCGLAGQPFSTAHFSSCHQQNFGKVVRN